ncbi:MAG: hypothetical protein GXO78_06925 [Calditrichaeota bacterium]|nr:hypothetical protein [Calditrichota bacterium]
MIYSITIEFTSPLHIGSGMGMGKLIDLRIVRDSNNNIYLPGSTVKGVLRSACNRIALENPAEFSSRPPCSGKDSEGICKEDPFCTICILFGTPFIEGKLRFFDLNFEAADMLFHDILKLDPLKIYPAQIKTSTKLSRYFHTVSPKQLYSYEMTPRNVIFKGKLEARGSLSPQEENLLKYASKYLSHIGGMKSRGLGRIKEFKIVKTEGYSQ